MVKRQWFVVSSLVGMVFPLQRAEACSCAVITEILTSVPANGATDVPLNVVPWFIGSSDVALVDEQGNIVPTVKEYVAPPGMVCAGGFELIPQDLLKPDTTYRLVANATNNADLAPPDDTAPDDTAPDDAAPDDAAPDLPQEPSSITFTTGETQAQSVSRNAPAITFVPFNAEEFTNSCVYSNVQACLDIDHEGLVDVRLVKGDVETQRYLGSADAFGNLELQNEGDVDCIEVRTRGTTGSLSEASRHCIDADNLPLLSRDGWPESADLGVYVDCDAVSAHLVEQGVLPPTTDNDSVGSPAPTEQESTTAAASTANAGSAASTEGGVTATTASSTAQDAVAVRSSSSDTQVTATADPSPKPADGRNGIKSVPMQNGCAVGPATAPATQVPLSVFALLGVGLVFARRRLGS
jgi:MYXO-CTERM domain-containing protein